jgi:hypothetical protein
VEILVDVYLGTICVHGHQIGSTLRDDLGNDREQDKLYGLPLLVVSRSCCVAAAVPCSGDKRRQQAGVREEVESGGFPTPFHPLFPPCVCISAY